MPVRQEGGFLREATEAKRRILTESVEGIDGKKSFARIEEACGGNGASAFEDADLHDVVVVVGGIVPDDEIPLLTDAGVMAVFHPGSSREEIVSTLSSLITEYRCN